MSNLELPEGGLLEFPCTIAIKAMGKSTPDFDAHVTTLVLKHISNLGEGAVKTRPSKNGNFISVTVTVTADNREQLDNIYQELTDDSQVLMAL
jgi:putative lipoic acid-binding regulatory protein